MTNSSAAVCNALYASDLKRKSALKFCAISVTKRFIGATGIIRFVPFCSCLISRIALVAALRFLRTVFCGVGFLTADVVRARTIYFL